MDFTRVHLFIADTKNDFWRGLSVILFWLDVHIHEMAVSTRRKVHYGQVAQEMKLDTHRFQFHARR